MKKNDVKEKFLEVKVFCTPVIEKEFFEGLAKAVSSKNRLGDFDVLPGHTNFITIILESLIIHTSPEKKINYQFSRGVLEVSEDKVNVFLGL